ncbi:hypothetical protein PCK1_003077 [Pneumocystis canis]|nr:hypothetical protein PCK1_003077 [Pneumocystis canis]
MAIKPVTNMLKRRLIKIYIYDITIALGLGISTAYVFWFKFHLPSIRKRDAYYEKLGRLES